MDSRLEGQYHSKGALQAAQLIIKCLNGDPKSRPSMKEVVEAMEKIESMKSRTREPRNSSSLTRGQVHSPRRDSARKNSRGR
uniref:Protein kinase domain-containing protein n=1 Tax=Arundo donax TaxID=35708 RepID=A0A0A9ERV8_ARUDO